ncbi:membrane associated protein with a signal egf domain and 7 transmembrane domains at the c-terminus [Cystoisospora suis]|uniref:Membrane associated protein with a signal egf domain and 7 transmembrane domains at the c-terminus n=1 Tax=Cystoisospora suis TaxID=483139 RepID=A0A2C6KIB7_9APIC|nr:membrane associated protein with a signal egf domain and 7 transmembrane domains at the c-terminus [Cystoisospora suis]
MLLTLSQKCPGNGDMGSSPSVTILPVQTSSTTAVVCRQWNSSTVTAKEHVACSLTRELGASEASYETWDSPSGVFPPPAPTLGSVDRTSSVFIFDLDDTLIPTEWIRSSYAAQKDDSRSPDEVYQSILAEINRRTCNELIPHILNSLRKAKSLCSTVAIVTNARSPRWLGVFESMFPEVVQLLRQEGIPIIRSCPQGQEPNIYECSAYFSYWMNAKKRKFEEVIRQHNESTAGAGLKRVDLISIGDNDFEEYAATHLALESPHSVRFAKVVRCRPGLTPEHFLAQLRDIQRAIDCVFMEKSPREATLVGNGVTYRIHGRHF